MKKQRKPRRPRYASGQPAKQRGTAEEMVARNQQIVSLADQGLRYFDIAARYQLNEEHVGDIVRRGRASRRKVLDHDEMVDHVNATLGMYEQAISDLAVRMVDMDRDHHAAYVGAMRLKMDTVRARWELLQAIGAVPQNLSMVRVQLEAIDVANELTAVFEAFEGEVVDDRFWEAAVNALEGKPWRGPQGQLMAPGTAPQHPADVEGEAHEMPDAA